MTYSNSNDSALCKAPINKEMCWKAGMDEELVLRMSFQDEHGTSTIQDLNGYSAVLEIRLKVTDAVPTLSVEASIDIEEGLYLFEVTGVETQALLTNTKKNYYVYRVVETNPSGKQQVLAEGRLVINI